MAKPNLASALKDDDQETAPGDELEAVHPESQAASLIREAIEDGDDESLADALKSFVSLCSAKAEPESLGPKGKPSLSLNFGKG